MEKLPDIGDLPPGENTVETNALLAQRAIRAAQAITSSGRGAGAARAAEEFRWPPPPYAEFIDEDTAPGQERCLLVFKDGTKAAGRLVSFLP